MIIDNNKRVYWDSRITLNKAVFFFFFFSSKNFWFALICCTTAAVKSRLFRELYFVYGTGVHVR